MSVFNRFREIANAIVDRVVEGVTEAIAEKYATALQDSPNLDLAPYDDQLYVADITVEGDEIETAFFTAVDLLEAVQMAQAIACEISPHGKNGVSRVEEADGTLWGDAEDESDEDDGDQDPIKEDAPEIANEGLSVKRTLQ